MVRQFFFLSLKTVLEIMKKILIFKGVVALFIQPFSTKTVVYDKSRTKAMHLKTLSKW